MKITVVEGLIRPRAELGCDWGIERHVLVRLMQGGKACKELWWHGGYTAWYCVGQTKYYGAELELAEPASYSTLKLIGGAETKTTTIQQGGRLSKKSFVTHAAQINEFFGAKVSHLLERGKTVVITQE